MYMGIGMNMCTKTEIKDVYQGVQGGCPQQAVVPASAVAINVSWLINLLFPRILNLIGTVIAIFAHFFPLFPNWNCQCRYFKN